MAEPQQPKPIRYDSLRQQAYLSLWRTYDRLKAYEDELFNRFGISAQQYNALRLLEAWPDGLPTLAIAERMISRAPDITRMIDRLEKAGWVSRERSTADRRAVFVKITPKGLALLKEIAGPLRECHDRQLGHLPQERLKLLIDLLGEAVEPHADRPTNHLEM